MTTVEFIANGQTYTGEEGSNLLETLLAVGVDVPNLCYNSDLEPYGGCGLCIVEIKGMPKIVRSCTIKLAAGMEVTTDSERLVEARRGALSLVISDHWGDCRPPCSNRCPSQSSCQAYAGLTAKGKFKEAVQVIKEDIPLPSCIGRVCPHPCEDDCRRKLMEGPVSIAYLKRFAGDVDLNSDDPYVPDVASSTGKKVAVVGAGPSGISAAYFLAIKGHAVEVFEAMPEPGGMLRYGIPPYRLPAEIIKKEYALIEKMGVKITYNTKLGKDITLDGLKQGFDAVYLAIGAWTASSLGCKNDDAQGVLGGIDFLRDINNGERPNLGKRVAVVGGGNTAMDACRSAARLGAEQVDIVYRRTRAEMPAEDIEIEEAQEEGVNFVFLASPSEVLVENGKAVGLRIQKMELGEPDASGRRSPVPIAGALEDIYYDTIISAIGQKVNPEGLDGLNLTNKKTIVSDEKTYTTNVLGVFAGGDATNKGPGIAIEAIADGKFASQAIDSYLAGELKPVVKPYLIQKKDVTLEDLPKLPSRDKVDIKFVDPKVRVKNFEEVAYAYTAEEAMKEGSRCLECGCCDYYDCRLLPTIQKHYSEEMLIPKGKNRKEESDQSNPFIWRDPNKCILCGLCIRSCSQLVGVAALGYNGRGFGTEAEPPFDWPMNNSDCISCGYCASVCPTGALQDRHPYTKSPALPAEKVTATCHYCSKACQMELHYYHDHLVKAYPLDRKRSCSIGRYGLVLAGAEIKPDMTREQEVGLLKAITGDLEYFEGSIPNLSDYEHLRQFLSE